MKELDEIVTIAPDRAGVVKEVSTYLLEYMKAVPKEKAKIVVAVAGGSVPSLIAPAFAKIWDTPECVECRGRIVFISADERSVFSDSNDYNAGYIVKCFKKEGISLDTGDKESAIRLHLVSGCKRAQKFLERGEVDAAALAYTQYLERMLGPDPLKIDLAILGMGPDGHICSLFDAPGELYPEEFYIGVCDSPKPPSKRISLSFAALFKAEKILFVVTGEEKAPAVRNALAAVNKSSLCGRASAAAAVMDSIGNKVRTHWIIDKDASYLAVLIEKIGQEDDDDDD